MTQTDKPVLLLLPGLMCDEAIWRGQIEAFGDAYDVQVADFSQLDSMRDMAERVLDMVTGRFAMAGHSMGGRVAMQVASTAPERVERICLLDTAGHPAPPTEAANRQLLLDIGDVEGIEGVVRAWLPPMVWPPRLGDRALMDEMIAMIIRAGVDVLNRQVRALLGRADGFEQLKALRCPTAFIVGRQDAWSPPLGHEQMQALVPRSTLTVIEDCGHMAPAERPDEVTTAMRRWLAST